MPMGIVGAAVGAIVGLVLPEPILVGVMTVVLTYISINMAIMLKNKCKAEKAAQITTAPEKKEVEMNTRIEARSEIVPSNSNDMSADEDVNKQVAKNIASS